jgi:hypothetical protein
MERWNDMDRSTARGLTLAALALAVFAGRATAQAPSGALIPASQPASQSASPLPPLPAGVTELRFADFYQPPGRYGLEFTDKLRSLNGRKVRILGYMVRRTTPQFARFLLTPFPVQMHDTEYGLADDLPAATMGVELPRTHRTVVPHTPGPMLLTGTLRLEPVEHADGRVTHVNLVLDPPPNPRRVPQSQPAEAAGTPAK